MKFIICFIASFIISTSNLFAFDNLVYCKNAPYPMVNSGGYLSEEIRYDSVTDKYWVPLSYTDDTTSIYLAYSDSLNGQWNVQSTPIVTRAGELLTGPNLQKFGSTWYLYIGSNTTGDMYVYTSSTVNGTYTDPGGVNPILANGAVGDFDENRATEPDIILVGSTYYMLYMGETVGTLVESVGLATASSPLGPWTKYSTSAVIPGKDVLKNNGLDVAADPIIYSINGNYLVGVAETSSGKNNWSVSYYSTNDFINYTRTNYTPSLRRGDNDRLDSVSSHRGGLNYFNGRLYSAYAGKDSAGTYRAFLGECWVF